MNVKEIVHEYLKRNGYECLTGNDCACDIDDLMPCDSCCDDCEPGYKIKEHCDKCENTCDAYKETEWCYTTKKPTEKPKPWYYFLSSHFRP